MPRSARLYLPGAVHHIIARFLNHEYLLRGSRERAAYLKRLFVVFARSDWTLLAYALMSNHIHLAALAGNEPVGHVIHPVHTGFAGWLNKAHARSGPAFAERFRSLACDEQHAARLIAYLHNNPVRAGLVADAAHSGWTSHRAYVGLGPRPKQLCCATGLRVCGFSDNAEGRRGFSAFVAEHAGAPRDPLLSGEHRHVHRRELRAAMNAPIEISDPFITEGGSVHEIWSGQSAPVRERWVGSVALPLALVAQSLSLDLALIQSSYRGRSVVRGRRLALMIWRRLHRPTVEMSQALGISSGAATHLLVRKRPAVADLEALAEEIAAECRAAASPKVRK